MRRKGAVAMDSRSAQQPHPDVVGANSCCAKEDRGFERLTEPSHLDLGRILDALGNFVG